MKSKRKIVLIAHFEILYEVKKGIVHCSLSLDLCMPEDLIHCFLLSSSWGKPQFVPFPRYVS